jgi:hypothetical protein
MFTLDELTDIVRACDFIEVEGCTPGFLQDFIVTRLEGKSPDLAATVRRLADEEMERLCAFIRAAHALLRSRS